MLSIASSNSFNSTSSPKDVIPSVFSKVSGSTKPCIVVSSYSPNESYTDSSRIESIAISYSVISISSPYKTELPSRLPAPENPLPIPEEKPAKPDSLILTFSNSSSTSLSATLSPKPSASLPSLALLDNGVPALSTMYSCPSPIPFVALNFCSALYG